MTLTPINSHNPGHLSVDTRVVYPEEGGEVVLVDPKECALDLEQLEREFRSAEELAVKARDLPPSTEESTAPVRVDRKRKAEEALPVANARQKVSDTREHAIEKTLEVKHQNLKKALLEHLERCSGLIETLLLENMAADHEVKSYLNKLKDDIKSSGRTHGTMKIVFGVLSAVPVLVGGLNTKERFGYKPENIQKMSEGIMYMVRQFGEAASVFIQTNQDVMKTDQRFQMDALESIKGKKRTFHETQREEGQQSVRTIDTFHDGFRQR